jgi:hypothetical protein
MRVVPSAEHKVRREALTVVHAGLVMSRERTLLHIPVVRERGFQRIVNADSRGK